MALFNVTFEDRVSTLFPNAGAGIAAVSLEQLSARLQDEGCLDEAMLAVTALDLAQLRKVEDADEDSYEGVLRVTLLVDVENREKIELLYPEIVLDYIVTRFKPPIYNDFDWKIIEFAKSNGIAVLKSK